MNEARFETGVAQSWGLSVDASMDDLVETLARRVAWLMKHDYERLLNAIYLLDVSEQKFREATGLATNDQTARAVAELIVAREREKFESRRRYRQARSVDVSADEVDEGRLPEP